MTTDAGWGGFWTTILDENGDPWLWEILADTENFFPDSSRESRLALAERLIRDLLADGWATLTGPAGDVLAATEIERVITHGEWRAFPPPPRNDLRLVPSAKWEQWAKEARADKPVRPPIAHRVG